MKVWTPHLNGAPNVPLTRTTVENARYAVMSNGNFTHHDDWRKAERRGWTIRPMALVEIKKKPKSKDADDIGQQEKGADR